MAIVTKGLFLFFIYAANFVFLTDAFAVVFFERSDAKTCSKQELFEEECNYDNAVQQRDCLIRQITQIRGCETLAATLDQQIVEKIKQKGKVTTDPLKAEKASILQKLKEFQRILDKHHVEMKSASSDFVRFVKSFTSEYKNSEIEVQAKLQKIFQSASEYEDHLDMIKIRFSAESLLRDEQTISMRFSQLASTYVTEFQGRVRTLLENLNEYKDFIDKNALKSSLPTYEKEINLARGIETYAVTRVTKIEDSVEKLVKQINAKRVVLKKKKIDQDKEKDFNLANAISKETEFRKYVSGLIDAAERIDDVFLQSDLSKTQKFQYFGARFKGVQKFMTLTSLCSADSLGQPQNDWLIFGCKRYEEYLPQAKTNLASRYAKNIKLALMNISWDKPDLKESREILAALDRGNLERAIELYDELLSDLANSAVTQ